MEKLEKLEKVDVRELGAQKCGMVEVDDSGRSQLLPEETIVSGIMWFVCVHVSVIRDELWVGVGCFGNRRGN